MVKFNQRLSDSVDEVVMQSDKVIQQLLDSIRVEIPHLFRVCESIALLDMLCAFVQVSTTRDYVKPEFKEALALKSARHPILEVAVERFIPNDCYATEQRRFQIITGCNMSGKSTYIRTLALLQVMAQIGCFVPALYASFTVIHSLFSRTSTDDSIEASLSTFSLEMREMAFILSNVDNKSLAIIDELGRGTSTRDGLSIAIAIAEALVQSGGLIFFATHFTDLTEVLSERPGVINLHLASEMSTAEDQVPKMTMLYKVTSGPNEARQYGINLAKAVGFPAEFIETAERVAADLRRRAEEQKQDSAATRVVKRRKLVLSLHEALKQTAATDMDDETLSLHLKQLQGDFLMCMEDLEASVASASQVMSPSNGMVERCDVIELSDDASSSYGSP